jgi:hypothetical protein
VRWLCLLVLTCGCKKDAPEEDSLGTSSIEAALEITAPEAAGWLEADQVDVTGTVEGLTDLKVNGEAVQASGGIFTERIALIPGINTIEVTGKDGDGMLHVSRRSVIAGEFGDANTPVENAATVRLNDSGFDVLAELVEDTLAGFDTNALISGANPVYADAYGAFGFDVVTINADVTNLSFDPPEIDIDAENGFVDLSVTLPNLDIALYAYGEIASFDFSAEAYMWADEAIVEGKLLIDAESGGLVVDFQQPEITLYGFNYDTSLLPGAIESFLFVDTIRDALEDMLVEKVDEIVPPLLGDYLSDLDLSFSTELLGVDMGVAATFADAWVDEAGVGITTDIDVEIPVSGEPTTSLGYFRNPGPAADPNSGSDLAMALRDDLMNRLLHDAWRGGMMSVTLSTADDSLDPLLLSALDASEGTITVRADLPPILIEQDEALVLQVGELIIDIDTPGGGLGSHTQIALAIDMPLEIGIDDAALALELGEPKLTLTVRETDWGRGGSTEAVTLLLEDKLPIETLLAVAGNLEIPIPIVADLTIGTAAVTRDDGGAATLIEATIE